MTISSTSNNVSYSVDGSTKSFSFEFTVYQKSDVNCYLVDSDGNETEYTDFSVTLNANNEGGTVTTSSAIKTSQAESILIIRETEETQDLDLIEGGKFPADSVEDALDKLTMLAQDRGQTLDNALQKSTSNTQTIGVGVLTSGKVVGYDGENIVSGTVDLDDVDSVTERNTAIGTALSGITGGTVTILQAFSESVGTLVSDVAYLTTGSVSGVHYFYYTGTGIGYYNADGVTGEITAVTIGDGDATITVDGSDITLTICYTAEEIRENIETNASDIATLTTTVATNKTEAEAGLTFYFDEDSSSAADAYVFTTQSGNQTLSSYHDGQIYRGGVASANTTTTPTLSIDGLTAYTIVTSDGAALVAGDIVAGAYLEVRYDASDNQFELLKATDAQAQSGTSTTPLMTPAAVASAFSALYPGSIISCTKYTASGTHTLNSKTKYVLVEIVGGGGAGGGIPSTSNYNYAAGGGGAGGYCMALFNASSLSSSIAITIGAAGTAAASANGGNGGASSFGSYITVSGGSGGVYPTTSQTTDVWSSAGGAGGGVSTITGYYVVLKQETGQAGGPGFTNAVWAVSGFGGSSNFGAGAQSLNLSYVSTASSEVGSTPGSVNFGCGGSGACGVATPNARAGGAGVAGVCIVTELY